MWYEKFRSINSWMWNMSDISRILTFIFVLHKRVDWNRHSQSKSTLLRIKPFCRFRSSYSMWFRNYDEIFIFNTLERNYFLKIISLNLFGRKYFLPTVNTIISSQLYHSLDSYRGIISLTTIDRNYFLPNMSLAL